MGRNRGNEKDFVTEEVFTGGYKGIFRVSKNGGIEFKKATYFREKCNDMPLVTLKEMEEAIVERLLKRKHSSKISF